MASKNLPPLFEILNTPLDKLKEKHVPRFTENRRRKQKWMDYGACKAVKKPACSLCEINHFN